MRRVAAATWLACAWSGVAVQAHAQDSTVAAASTSIEDSPSDGGEGSPFDSRANLGLVIGGKVGAGLGQPFNEFGATPVLELELGYAPDLGDTLGRSLEIFWIGQYAQPGLDGSGAEPDPRLPGSEPFTYDITQQMFSMSLGALYRFDIGSDLLMPYGGLGGRMYMLRTQSKGQVDGQSFGDSDEVQTDFGLMLLGGLEAYVGPGALLAELSFGWAQLDGFIMRDTNLSALSLSVGYRVVL